MPEDLSSARESNSRLGERIAKVENMVDGLHAGKNVGTINHAEGELRQGVCPKSDPPAAGSGYSDTSAARGLPSPVEVNESTTW